MLPDHLGHVGVAQRIQDAGPQLRMIVASAQTLGLAQVVEEGAHRHQRQMQVKTGLRQGLAQKTGHLHDPEAVLPDIGEHAVDLHQLQALIMRREED